MRIDIATLFPDMCGAVLGESVLGRGIKNGFIEIYTHDIRLYTENKHRRVDDAPYGGGTGMVMQAQPVYDCIMAIKAQHKTPPRVIYMSPKGEVLTQKKVEELAKEDGLILLCGHYEGVDERVLEELSVEELSVGDYVLTGGELPALIVADAVARLQRGVLPNEDAYSIESHYGGLLEYPQYSRPEVWRGRRVPEELLSGDHKRASEWQRRASLAATAKKRPDMYKKYIDDKTKAFWREFIREKNMPEELCYSESFSFGMSEDMAEKLLRLVLRGKKRACSSSLYAYEKEGEDLPQTGEYSIVTDWYGIPRCVILTVRVSVIPFKEMTFDLCQKEGEDKELCEWREKHERFFTEEGKEAGYEFSRDMPVVFEEFKVVYKARQLPPPKGII